MSRWAFELPDHAWRTVWRWSALITLASILASLGLTGVIMHTLSDGMSTAGWVVSATMPALVGGPLIFFMVMREQQLRHANQQLRILASTDGLTACLNRRAFTHSVTNHLTWSGGDPAQGAFLVIDADDFKSINDHFGHDHGDEALRSIAGAIKASVRPHDLVGRIGGEEFGVFLVGVSGSHALVIAERIRTSINQLAFAPEGDTRRLSVSIGGAVFDRPAPFAALYRKADELLYKAKQSGRDRVFLDGPDLLQTA